MTLQTDQISDPRLIKRLNHIYSQMTLHQSAIVNQFSKEHKDKMGAYRFLNNTDVTPEAILSSLVQSCNNNTALLSHVLCIQDTSEMNYERHAERIKKKTAKPGIVSQRQCGIFVHPVLVVNALSGIPLGFSSVKMWNRPPDAPSRQERNYRYQPIEEKESYRWIESGLQASKQMDSNTVKTIIGDREADIFELFSRVPDKNVHLLIRSVHDRNCQLDDSDFSLRLDKLMDKSALQWEYSFEVLPESGRKKRMAHMELRFEKITLRAPVNGAPASKEAVTLYCIHVKEKACSTPENEKPIEWRLLTTHTVETVEQAIQCVQWYRLRWLIEELFRVLKRKGFMIEDAQLETIPALQKLILISLQAALKVMILKLSFDKEDQENSSKLYFTDKEIALLKIVGKKCEGKTKIQQNPYKRESMAWAAWIIARLGAWSAYKSQSIPGYITMKNGLDYFNTQFELYDLIT